MKFYRDEAVALHKLQTCLKNHDWSVKIAGSKRLCNRQWKWLIVSVNNWLIKAWISANSFASEKIWHKKIMFDLKYSTLSLLLLRFSRTDRMSLSVSYTLEINRNFRFCVTLMNHFWSTFEGFIKSRRFQSTQSPGHSQNYRLR